ncbi:MAG: dTMP kinase, partial [Candidatus Omnitrophica bacterium]|nr:dTMP kinase [Candidatus Omnitrophota bacterium]
GKEDITPETETLLYMASRKELVKNVIRPKLEDGYTVICDRWLDATIAYQSYGSGVSRKWIESVAKEVVSGLKPDVTFWLDVPVKTGLNRAGKRADLDKIERRALTFHNAVRSGYAALASRHKRIRRIAPAGIELTHRRIAKIIHEIY